MPELALPGLDPDPASPPPRAGVDLDALLYGRGGAARLVAVEVGDRSAVLFRSDEGAVRREEVSFRPWLLARDRGPAPGAVPGATWTALAGDGYCWRAEFESWGALEAAREDLRGMGVPVLCYGSPAKQYLVASGNTLFRGMRFAELHRLQLDLETTTLDPARPEARILLAAVGDNRGGEWVFYDRDEATLLRQLVECIRRVDPDVVEGHNLFNFDLPYLAARAAALQVPLALGRDGSALRFGRERNCPIGGNLFEFRPAHLWGRHCVDTLLAAQRFDIGRGELESYGLKECARVYGLEETDRILLERERMAELWEADPERVRRYALQDVRETRRLADLVTPTEFYQAQMVPDSYQNVATTGSGEKINALFVRAYLAAGLAIPQAQPPRPFAGGYTEVRRTGLVRRVVKADVESLYPSLMLRHGIRPAADTLGIFLPLLRHLTDRRLAAKAAVGSCPAEEREYWNGLQLSFKILINSFYGYLGGPFHFNDYDAAEQVTRTGQQIVRQVADLLEAAGCQVIEIDTDGVYFVPPAGVDDEASERALVERIAAQLPPGIRLAYDGRYAAMLSLKIKNYVLLDHAGRKIFRGGSLRSRADERFGREFIAAAVDCLIRDDREALARAYSELADRLLKGEVPVERLARRERVTEKMLQRAAQAGGPGSPGAPPGAPSGVPSGVPSGPPSGVPPGPRAAAGELRLGESLLLYRRADGTMAPIAEYAGDEDRGHYLEKLRKFAARLEEAIGPDFDRLCPRISRHRVQAEMAGQGSLFEL